MIKKEDLVGRRFGRLMVVSEAENSKGKVMWGCICDCGNRITTRADTLRSGNTKSCGCLQKERHRMALTKHGKSEAQIYHVWEGMKGRCQNENATGFERYGGRGIKVCERWNKFENFYKDMGDVPSGLTIDRRNNEGNYEPGNCRWATREEQQQNTRRSRLLNYKGERMCLAEWARKLKLPKSTLFNRLVKHPPEVAFHA